MKACTKCGQQKQLFDFYADGKGGHQAACKKCKAEYKSKNKEKTKAYDAAYRKKNAESRKRYNSDWRKNNPERVRSYSATYYEKNAEKARAKASKRRKDNPGAEKLRSQERRAKKNHSCGSLSPGIVEKLFALQKGLCPCCGESLGKDFHLDHILPLALGGEHSDQNVQLLRAKCNLQKHAKHPVDFMQSRGWLL